MCHVSAALFVVESASLIFRVFPLSFFFPYDNRRQNPADPPPVVRLFELHALCGCPAVRAGRRFGDRHGVAAESAAGGLHRQIRLVLGADFRLSRPLRRVRLGLVCRHHAVSRAQHRAVPVAQRAAVLAGNALVPPQSVQTLACRDEAQRIAGQAAAAGSGGAVFCRAGLRRETADARRRLGAGGGEKGRDEQMGLYLRPSGSDRDLPGRPDRQQPAAENRHAGGQNRARRHRRLRP